MAKSNIFKSIGAKSAIGKSAIRAKSAGRAKKAASDSSKRAVLAASRLSATWPPEQPRSVALEAFARLRKAMAAQGLLEGATTYAFLFNQLRAYLALSPERPFPTLGNEPARLSPAGEALDALAKAAALDIVSLCKKSGLPPLALSQVYDAMVPLYLQAVNTSYTTPPQSRPPTRPASPVSGLSERSRQNPGRHTLSLTPSKSAHALWRVEYEQRLNQLAHDLRQLLALGPRLFGPIPSSKREYVEQLLALIEEHEHRYKAGSEAYPFRFSRDEKAELENFCPAFKLRGLEWLETEGPRSG